MIGKIHIDPTVEEFETYPTSLTHIEQIIKVSDQKRQENKWYVIAIGRKLKTDAYVDVVFVDLTLDTPYSYKKRGLFCLRYGHIEPFFEDRNEQKIYE